ncbi:hypothetical protein CHS0354_022516 [Potamilus streckersoni]|uniref:Uncharacterized protein n=1 Tax=Potamilus streckersoni TaxID=2493646 RepID=A0AAE0VQD6_9BIVA|nr:hypothetical protein CHS0354_022516 [Potamilus streckersoni]
MTVTDFENKLDNSYLGGNANENKVKLSTASRDPVVAMNTREVSEKYVAVAFDALLAAKRHIEKHERKSSTTVLIVGANQSGRIAAEHAPMVLANPAGKVNVFIADSSIERLMAIEEVCNDVICWSADEHEQSLVEKTRSTCAGGVDLILDFIGTSRTTQRAMKILNKGGALLIGPDSLPNVSISLCTLIAQQQSIIGVPDNKTNEATTFEDLLHLLVA